MNPETRQYFTLAYAILDVPKGEVRYVAAAHPGPVHVVAAGGIELHEPSGLAIGWFPHASYEDHVVPVAAGDRLYFYSDGLPEAMNEFDEQFGFDRLCAVLDAHRGNELEASIDALVGEVQSWCGERGPHDDISVLAVEIDAT